MKVVFSVLAVLAISAAATAQVKDTVVVKEDKVIVVTNKDGASNQHITIVGDSMYINGEGFVIDRGGNGSRRVQVTRAPISARGYTYNINNDGDSGPFLGVYAVDDEKGALLTRIERGTPAALAKLRVDDIITSINNKKITGASSLTEAIKAFKVGETVVVNYLRAGSNMRANVKLGQRDAMQEITVRGYPQDLREDVIVGGYPSAPTPPAAPRAYRRAPSAAEVPNLDRYFFEIETLFEQQPKFGMSVEDNPNGDGAIVKEIEKESMAASAGLEKEDIITYVNNVKIKTIDGLRAQLFSQRSKGSLQLKVLRKGAEKELELKVPKQIKKADL